MAQDLLYPILKYEKMEVIYLYDVSNLKISEHVQRRYVERIEGKYEKSDQIQRLANEGDIVNERITKLVQYSEEVYYGLTFDKKNNKNINTRVLVKDAWIILVSSDNIVITLFKKDFGFDDEDFNKDYMKRLISVINEKTETWTQIKADVASKKSKLNDEIEELDNKIFGLKNSLKQFENLRESRVQERNNLAALSDEAQRDIENFINSVTGETLFRFSK